MICSNCGKDISIVGKVCPYCKADKTGDVAMQVNGTAGGCLGLVVGVGLGILTKSLAIGFYGSLIFFFGFMALAMYASKKE